MADFQDLVDEAIRAELGKGVTFLKYGRTDRTPMNFVLDEAERQLGAKFVVYWTDDGPPALFSLPGLSPSPVVFSRRFLSLTAFARKLFVDDTLESVRQELAEQTALKLMA